MQASNDIESLKEHIRLLEQENKQLTERAEDTLMLGLVSEAIENEDAIEDGINAALERIAMLKDLAVVAYCHMQQDCAKVVQSYVSFAHQSINHWVFSLPLAMPESGVMLLDDKHPLLPQLYIEDIDFKPTQVLLMKTKNTSEKGVFFFAIREQGRCLQGMIPILERIIHITDIMMENRYLLKCYKELNEELDYRVEIRSRSLQESENKYHTLVESSDTAIMLLSNGIFVECNAATLAIFACPSKEEFFKLSPAQLSPAIQPDGSASLMAAGKHMALAIEQGSDRFDWVHRRLDGEEFYADVHLSKVLIQGQVMIQGVVIDISDRIVAEKALHRYRHIVSSSLDMMAILDKHAIYLTVNTMYLKAFNKQSHDIVGHSVQELFGEEFFSETTEPYFQRCLSGETIHFQSAINFPAYGVRYMDMNFYPYSNDDHEIVGVVVNGRDITEQQHAKQALKQSEKKYRELIENMQDCVYRTDQQGRLTFASQAIETLMGDSVDAMLGDQLSDYYVHPEERAYFLQRLKDSKDGRVDGFEVQVQRKDGTLIWLSANSHLMHDDAGHICGVEGSLRDITSLKEMEAKFNQAQKMDAIGTLVGGIAHDFNNILAGMVGSLYLMKYKHADHPELLQAITGLEEQAFRASDMIKQLLSFSRKGALEIKQLSFTTLAQETHALAKHTTPENIALHLHACEEDLLIQGDASLLQQVLINLINNSRDAVAHVCNPYIEIRLHEVCADEAFIAQYKDVRLGDKYAHLSVQDNGCGISKDHLKHVFEPFYTTKGVGKGTGLGLAMIYGTIQSHHGMIALHSVVDKGTTTDIFLPIALSESVDASHHTEQMIVEGHGEMVLCVDDEDAVCDVHSEILRSFGYQVLQASDGLHAMDIFAEHKEHIALIVTDVVMPNMGGIELAKSIWKSNPALPVLFISGYNEEHLAELPKHAEYIRILKKPFTVEVLSEALHGLLTH